jgi:hypothetical protein
LALCSSPSTVLHAVRDHRAAEAPFGEYATDGLTIAPAAFDARLNLSPPGDAAAASGMAA